MNIFFVLVVATISGLAEFSSATQLTQSKTRLFNHLFHNYEKIIEPSNADVSFDITLMCAHGDIKDGKPLVSNVVEKYLWKDHRFVWDPHEYDGVTLLRVPDHLIWKPDMKLYYYLEVSDYRDPCNADILYNGTVIWFPRCVFKTFCTQEHCQYNMGLWTYDVDSVPIKLWSNEPLAHHYDNSSCPLKIKSITSERIITLYPYFNSSYAYFQYNLTFEQD